ncbi:MAG: hypothetical protein H6810_12405 [Phycisphaeraceae bacterium]|nr:MAG: hypothetical protein H6810_12405 [Phycisphaeraceae bacterium]
MKRLPFVLIVAFAIGVAGVTIRWAARPPVAGLTQLGESDVHALIERFGLNDSSCRSPLYRSTKQLALDGPDVDGVFLLGSKDCLESLVPVPLIRDSLDEVCIDDNVSTRDVAEMVVSVTQIDMSDLVVADAWHASDRWDGNGGSYSALLFEYSGYQMGRIALLEVFPMK